jgi:hypothetical protein
MFMTFKILSSIVRTMRHIARFEEYVTGLIDRRLVTFHAGELTGDYDADARTSMMVVANVSPGRYVTPETRNLYLPFRSVTCPETTCSKRCTGRTSVVSTGLVLCANEITEASYDSRCHRIRPRHSNTLMLFENKYNVADHRKPVVLG